MISYVTLGSNDIPKAAAFYDELLAGLNAKKVYDTEGFVAWGAGENQPMLSIITPNDKKTATVGNGVMVALNVPSVELIDALHAQAIAMGAENEGDPGLREDIYYCAYFRDLDGNKLNLFCMPEK